MKPKEPPIPNGTKAQPWGGEPLNTSDNATSTGDKVKVNVPVSILRWLAYSFCFACLLIPMTRHPWQIANGGFILGWFASQLNALIHKK